MPSVEAVALPDHLGAEQLRGKIAVVIDVLRATTTIAAAIEQGAACVVPVASVDGARMIAHARPGAILCGERGGRKPGGFTLGNSPLEYTADIVQGSACVLTTTNGTRAMHMCAAAGEILIGAITNVEAVCAWIEHDGRDVVLVCSGTDRRISLEDCVGAGLFADRLALEIDDSAALMRLAMLGAIEKMGSLEAAVASSFHAGRLVDLGFEADVRQAAQTGSCGVVPIFDPGQGEIRVQELECGRRPFPKE